MRPSHKAWLNDFISDSSSLSKILFFVDIHGVYTFLYSALNSGHYAVHNLLSLCNFKYLRDGVRTYEVVEELSLNWILI